MPTPGSDPHDRLRSRRGAVTVADVAALEDLTADLRALDYRSGGGSCRAAVVAQLPIARVLLDRVLPDALVTRLRTAVADLHNLAGWVCFDAGSPEQALRHLEVALRLATAAGNDALAANVHYRRGRVLLHHDAPGGALHEFGSSLRSAGAAGSPLATAIAHANEAWTRARLGWAEDARAGLALARDSFAQAEAAPGWAAFFTAGDLSGITGVVHTELARSAGPTHVAHAVPALTEALDSYHDDMARSRVMVLIALAVCQLVDGQVDLGASTGERALRGAQALSSPRTWERLRPLAAEAARHRRHPGAHQLAERITALLLGTATDPE